MCAEEAVDARRLTEVGPTQLWDSHDGDVVEVSGQHVVREIDRSQRLVDAFDRVGSCGCDWWASSRAAAACDSAASSHG